LAEFDIDVTWRMLGEGHPNCYVDVAITSDMSFNAIIRLITANELQIIEFYLNRKLFVFGVDSGPRL
jgi:hypothetical protein